jgi:alpha-L-fucosidase
MNTVLIAAILTTAIQQGRSQADDWASILISGSEKADAAACIPSPRQLAYQEKQLGAFVHFGLPTYAVSDAEYNAVFPFNAGSVPDPSRFNPGKIDAEQWVLAAKSFGAKHLVFPAKHHDGFCLWPTKTTDYSVRNTPWKNGKGDLVREVADACKKHGLAMGIYCSPADRHQGCWVDPTKNHALVGDREAYFRVYQEQLCELLTGYGDMVMVWFDNHCDPFSRDTTDPATGERIGHGRYDEAIVSLVRSLQPNAVVLRYRSALSDLRAVGNEDGSSPYPIWNVVRKGEGAKYPELLSPEAEGWYFCETDIPTRPDWIWRPNTDAKLHSVDRLLKAYTDSIGHGANILINITPDPSGLVPKAEEQRLADFGAELHRRLSLPVAQTDSNKGWATPGVLELRLDRDASVAYVVLEEDLSKGQHILQYAIDAKIHDRWEQVAEGQSIGRKRIHQFASPIATNDFRLRIVKADAIPTIREMAVFQSTDERHEGAK